MIILLFSAWLIGDKPPSLTDSEDELNQNQGLGFKQVRRTRQFWLICAMQFMLFASLMTIPVHIVIHAQDLGFETTTAAAELPSIGAVSIINVTKSSEPHSFLLFRPGNWTAFCCPTQIYSSGYKSMGFVFTHWQT